MFLSGGIVKNNKEISDFFEIFNKKMSNFYTFMESTYYEIDFISSTQIEDFRESLHNVEDKFISGNSNDFNVSLIEYTNLCTEIYNSMYRYIAFNKYNIQNLINDFFDSISLDDNDDYKELRKYYKYKNKMPDYFEITDDKKFKNNHLELRW